VKFCQKEKLKIKILSKSNFGGFSRQKWGKEKSPDSYIWWFSQKKKDDQRFVLYFWFIARFG
jgi:hypothetical protein